MLYRGAAHARSRSTRPRQRLRARDQDWADGSSLEHGHGPEVCNESQRCKPATRHRPATGQANRRTASCRRAEAPVLFLTVRPAQLVSGYSVTFAIPKPLAGRCKMTPGGGVRWVRRRPRWYEAKGQAESPGGPNQRGSSSTTAASSSYVLATAYC